MLAEEVINRCVIEQNGCITWEGAHDGKGYPHAYLEGRTARVFRFLYVWFIGLVPINHELHHRCENKACVNPFHVEPVTKSEHKFFKHPQALRTHCPKGHELTLENTYVLKNKTRQNSYKRSCRICERERKSTPEYLAYMRAYYYRRKAERGA